MSEYKRLTEHGEYGAYLIRDCCDNCDDKDWYCEDCALYENRAINRLSELEDVIVEYQSVYGKQRRLTYRGQEYHDPMYKKLQVLEDLIEDGIGEPIDKNQKGGKQRQ